MLFSQGFGARRICQGLIGAGLVTIDGTTCLQDREVDPDGLCFAVRGERWPYHHKALIVLNKPSGYECSQKPKHHPSVMSLLPAPLRVRGVQPVGRLDADTTGLLLFTDDGALIHRLTSPKRHVPKVYDIDTVAPILPTQVEALLHGVLLADEDTPVRAAACRVQGPQQLQMTLLEGKYHQVKRMLAAAGNSVASLHRSRYGTLALPHDLAPGQWRWLPGPQAVLAE